MFLQKTDVNTGRQVEFDYLKGLFIPMILLIHSFQVLMGMNSTVYHAIYMICTLTGSTIFLFVMGLGSMYSGRSPKQMVKDGLRLIWYQVLWNVFSMALPVVLGQGLRALFGAPTQDKALMLELISVSLQYINIFFIAGVSYLFLALFKKFQMKGHGYLILGILLLVATPFLYMLDKSTGIPALDYFLTTFAGGRAAVSLCFLPHFVYVLFGAWFGSILRRTNNKKKLYLTLTPGAVVILIAYIVVMVCKYPVLSELALAWEDAYVFPDILRMLANISCTLLSAAILYALSGVIQKAQPIHKSILHLCKHTSLYYGIHPFFYTLIFVLANCVPFSTVLCLVMFVAVFALCRLTVVFWLHIHKPKKA